MKLLIDMNLSPQWVWFLQQAGIEAVHWSEIGDPKATDQVLLEAALAQGCVVFTHDLDFSRILSLTRAAGPSVFQVRTEDVLPSAIGSAVLRALQLHSQALERGALIVLDHHSLRVRILPL